MNDKCPCGSVESDDNTLLHCGKYTSIRDETIFINENFDMNVLLNMCPLYSEDVKGKIFNIVQRYIVESDRFF